MQCGDALGDEARLRAQDVASLEQFDVPVAVVQAMYFVGVEREWGPLFFSQRIVQRHQQAATTGRQPGVQLVHVADPCVSFSTSVAACLRRASIRQAVRRVSPAPRPCAHTSTLIAPPRAAGYGGYSTERPSTFCQPLGNNPPRVARLPTYSPRSLNDNVIVRLPERIESIPAGGTTATATTRSVPSFALGMSITLLPLPRSSSGSSETGNASRWPALVTATTRSDATSVTAAGCTTFAPGVSDSSALPALLRPVRFSKRVTNPYPCELAITKRASLSPVASAWKDAPGTGAKRPVNGSPFPRALGSVCAAVE